MKKWCARVVATFMIMVFAMRSFGTIAQAEEVTSTKIATNEIQQYNNEVRPLTTMFDCEIILAFTGQGLEMDFTTSSYKVSSVIGVKDIKVQQKMWYGWKTVFTSDGAENKDEAAFCASLTYPDAVNGKTYRVTCVHYANYDVYEEVKNDTGAFKFIY